MGSTKNLTSSSSFSSSADLYQLQRDHVSATRLNSQHWIWRKELGYNLHPSIPVPLTSARIADVATGTGLWLLEVAEEHPTAQFDGFDIKLDQSPPNAWLPSNIKIHQWDMMDPSGPPTGLHGYYDIVHVRMVILAVEDNVDQLVRNLIAMLKPGGWLQWDETDVDHPQLANAAGDGVPIGDSLAMVNRFMLERPEQDWCRNLPGSLTADGFEEVKRFEIAPDLRLLKFATDGMLMVWEELLAKADDERRPLLEKLVTGFRNDVAKGSGLAHPKLVTIARRPS